MNTIQNHSMTNYQIGFQSKQSVAEALQKNFDATRTTRFFREGESLEQCILNINYGKI